MVQYMALHLNFYKLIIADILRHQNEFHFDLANL